MYENEGVLKLAKDFYNTNKLVCAICIAPRILTCARVINGRKATTFPDEQNIEEIKAQGVYTGKSVEVDGNGSSCSYGPFAWNLTNGETNGRNSEWFGTVWVPYAGARIGAFTSQAAANFTGALWSGTQVNIVKRVNITHVVFQDCSTPPDVSAGPDKQLSCFLSEVQLLGSSSTPGVSYHWEAGNGGHILSWQDSPNPTVDAVGSYSLTVTDAGGCTATDQADVTFGSCILPYYPPPAGGKVPDLIGSELNSLYYLFGSIDPDSIKFIFNITNDSVWIEVISIEGQYNTLLSLLQTETYGLTYLISNGPNSLIITGKYPIAHLLKLDSLPQLINYVRPVFPPISNAGVAYSEGDSALLS